MVEKLQGGGTSMGDPHPNELVPIQTFMRRFSHVEAGQEESSRASRDAGEATLAAAAAAKLPTASQRCNDL